MACPFFVPVQPLGREQWRHAPRFPLGREYRGACHAGPQPFTPPDAAQEELCNCGYARGRCSHFPAESAESAESADAVRFSILSDDGARIRLVYIFERAHSPAGHGTIEYTRSGAHLQPDLESRLGAQAAAFLASYLRNAEK